MITATCCYMVVKHKDPIWLAGPFFLGWIDALLFVSIFHGIK